MKKYVLLFIALLATVNCQAMNEAEKQMGLFDPFETEPDPWPALSEQLGYVKAIQSEAKDGLIALDVRAIDAPSFEKWLEDNRRFWNEVSCFKFRWRIASASLLVELEVYISNSASQVRNFFRDSISAVIGSNPNRQHIPWKPCKKQIGTVCVRAAIKSMFVYKNVFVTTYVVPAARFPEGHPLHNRISEWSDESLLPKSPNGEPWDEVIAEWFFGILKNAPRYKTFPAEPIPLK
jgi:hypothetical protein